MTRLSMAVSHFGSADFHTDGAAPMTGVFFLHRENNRHRKEAVTFACLGKLMGADGTVFSTWKRFMRPMLADAIRRQALTCAPLIVGLAESGIIPSALFYQLLRDRGYPAEWVCSTRRPAAGLRFRERHSHAPDHTIPIPRQRPREIWFIEDEITTGRTLLELAVNLCAHTGTRRIRCFAFLDSRSAAQRQAFAAVLGEKGIRHAVHCLWRREEGSDSSSPLADPLRSSGQAPGALSAKGRRAFRPERSHAAGWHLPDCRPGLKGQQRMPSPEAAGISGSLLVVGEAVDLGLHLTQVNPGLQMHHVTLSPWVVNGDAIKTRLEVADAYYLYNPHRLRAPVHLLNDPLDEVVGRAVVDRLRPLGYPVTPIRFPRPGQETGSHG